MDLYLLRHGQTAAASGRTYNQFMVTNGAYEKTLTFEGKANVERVGKALKSLNIKPDAIITSPLKRSYQTAEIIESILFGNKSIRSGKSRQPSRFQVWNELAPEGNTTNIFKNLSKFKYDSKILIVGHEPFLSKMIIEILNTTHNKNARTTYDDSGRQIRSSPSTSYLINADSGIVLKKAGLAKLRISSKSQQLTGELRWLLTPKLLRKLTMAKKKSNIKIPKNESTKLYPEDLSTR
jgi:phosphohistidine phosphatase